jgi:hypothetical protein
LLIQVTAGIGVYNSPEAFGKASFGCQGNKALGFESVKVTGGNS